MGFHTDKPMAMFRPTDVEVETSQPEAEATRYVPATVVDRIDLYYMMKYFVRLDDGLVRAPRRQSNVRGSTQALTQRLHTITRPLASWRLFDIVRAISTQSCMRVSSSPEQHLK